MGIDQTLPDFDVGDTFIADYIPTGWEDAPGMPYTVLVQVLGFNDDECDMEWKILDGIIPELMDDIGGGFGWDEFSNVRCYKQEGKMEEPMKLLGMDQIDPGFWYIVNTNHQIGMPHVHKMDVWGPFETEDDAKHSNHFGLCSTVMIGSSFNLNNVE